MHKDFPVIENQWFEKHEALLESYVERIFEASSLLDMFDASHWYVNAIAALNTPSTANR